MMQTLLPILLLLAITVLNAADNAPVPASWTDDFSDAGTLTDNWRPYGFVDGALRGLTQPGLHEYTAVCTVQACSRPWIGWWRSGKLGADGSSLGVFPADCF
jgi:hypothetical protein